MLQASKGVLWRQAEGLAEMGCVPDKVIFLDAPHADLKDRAQRRHMTLASTQGELHGMSEVRVVKR